VAIRGSILYFVIADLAGIDPMYQYSLVYVKRLFNAAIEKSKKSRDLEERLEILIDNITRIFYTNVSRGIFETHKIIFSFLITTSINRNIGRIQESHWNLLLRGAGPLTSEQIKIKRKNPDPKLLSTIGWDLLVYADFNEPSTYGGIVESVITEIDQWSQWATSNEPHTEPLPLDWNEKLTNFERTIILKAFRPEKLLFAF
jgi:dynein heavy chain